MMGMPNGNSCFVISIYSSSSFAFKQASMQADHRVSGEGGRAEISIRFLLSGCSNFREWAWSLIPPDFSVRSKPYLMSPFMGIPK